MTEAEIKKPNPIIMHATISIPQLTLEEQQNTPTTDVVQADLQAGINSDTTYTQGTVVSVEQKS